MALTAFSNVGNKVHERTVKIKSSIKKEAKNMASVHANEETVDTPLLKFESNWMMGYQWPITTIQYYTGDTNAAATWLENRWKEVVTANPWVCSTLVKDKKKHGKLLAMRYSKDSPDIARTFQVKDGLDLDQNMPYADLCKTISDAKDICVSNGNGLIKSEMPVCKLTFAPNKEKNGFAVIFSMCHVVGDGHTYYSILNMLSATSEIVGMDVTRNEKFSMEEAGPEITGEKEYKFLLSPPFCMMCYYMGIMMKAKKVEPECYYVDTEKLKELKEKAKTEEGAAPYVSTNDLITSGFGRAVKAQMLHMPANIRGKKEGCGKNLAGNYITEIILGDDALTSANSIRQILNGKAPFSRGKMPGCCISGNWAAMITNWSSMSEGNVEIPDCTQTMHLPYLNTKEMMEDSCVIFKARPNQVACMFFLQSVTIEDVKKELPFLREKVSETMFGAKK